MLRRILINRKLSIWRVDNLTLTIFPKVFNPKHAFSTTTLLKFLKKIFSNTRYRVIIDYGAGCGVLAIFLARSSNYVIAVDINYYALLNAKINAKINKVEHNVDYVVSNSLRIIRRGAVDYVVSNPPYLPCPIEMCIEVCAGSRLEIIQSLIQEAREILKYHGRIIFTISSMSYELYRRVIRKRDGMNIVFKRITPIDLIYIIYGRA